MEQTEKCLTTKNQTPNSKEYSGLRKLEYFRPNVVRLDLPFILTKNKILVLNMPYLKLEGTNIDAVRLLNVWDEDGYVYLEIKNLKTGQVNSISWLLEYNGDYWLWSLASFSYLSSGF